MDVDFRLVFREKNSIFSESASNSGEHFSARVSPVFHNVKAGGEGGGGAGISKCVYFSRGRVTFFSILAPFLSVAGTGKVADAELL
jgi:hypothetical protein